MEMHTPRFLVFRITDVNAVQIGTPLTTIAALTKRYIQIHPFVDGNGRSGRIFLDYMLMRAGYSPLPHDPAFWRELMYVGPIGLANRMLDLYGNTAESKNVTPTLSSTTDPKNFSAETVLPITERPSERVAALLEALPVKPDGKEFRGTQRGFNLSKQAVLAIADMSRTLPIPLRFSSTQTRLFSKGAADSRKGRIFFPEADSFQWKLQDKDLIVMSYHEAGHLSFGQNMDYLSDRWRKSSTNFATNASLEFRRHQAERKNRLDRVQKIDNIRVKFEEQIQIAANIRPIRSAYDEFMADFTASLIKRDPRAMSNVILKIEQLYHIQSSISESDALKLRHFDVKVDGPLKQSWQSLMNTSNLPYIFFSPSRRPLWLKVEQAIESGVPFYVIYERVFHLLRRNFDSLGPELEKGTLDPEVANANLQRDIQNLSF